MYPLIRLYYSFALKYKISSIIIAATLHVKNIPTPTGGVYKPTVTIKASSTPKCIKSIPYCYSNYH